MNEDNLDKIRRELEKLRNMCRTGEDKPDQMELEYYLSRLSTALTGLTHMAFRSLSPYQRSGELLAQVDTLLAETDKIHELAERVREVLLRPAADEKPAGLPGFN